MARLLARFGRRVLVAGGLIDAAGMVMLGVGLSASWPHPSGLALVPGMMVIGLGQGLLMSPIFGVLLSDVPAHLAGAGSGVTATMQQSSLALGVATVGSGYLTLTGDIGALHATLVILGVITAILILMAGLCVRLLRTSPSPPHRAPPRCPGRPLASTRRPHRSSQSSPRRPQRSTRPLRVSTRPPRPRCAG